MAYDSAMYVKEYLLRLISELNAGKDKAQVIDEILKDKNFGYLAKQTEEKEVEGMGEFSRDTKSKAFLTEAIPAELKCKICEGFIHPNAMNIDHIQRIREGGSSSVENAQLSHPYCNTTYKH